MHGHQMAQMSAPTGNEDSPDDNLLQQVLDSLSNVVPRQHTVYDNTILENEQIFKPLFQVLGKKERLPYQSLQKISEKTNIPVNTLKTWRKNLKKDANWTPRHGSPGCPRLLTDTQELRLKLRIINDYVSKGLLITRRQTQIMAAEMFMEEARKRLEEQARYNDFDDDPPPVIHGPETVVRVPISSDHIFSRHWEERFEERTGLSYRVPHLKRRTPPDDEAVAKFLDEIEFAKAQFTRDSILNADETCWRVVNGKLKTLALKGSQEVTVHTSFDTKQAITVMACMTAAGKKLPLMVIVEGTTELCERKFRTDKRLRHYVNKSLFFDHTERGWSTHEFTKRYIKFLSRQMKERDLFLIWDLHASHRREDVREQARQNSVHLSFVPAGQTAYWQPLDAKVFGALKKKAMKEFENMTLERPLTEFTIVDAICILIRVWEEMPEAMLRRAWDRLLGPVDATDDDDGPVQNGPVDENDGAHQRQQTGCRTGAGR